MKYRHFGLSFRGGSTRGFGAIGMIRFFQEHQMEPTVLAGSSSGALLAALYAQKRPWTEIVDITDSMTFGQYFSPFSILEDNSIFSEQKTHKLLKKIFGNLNIEELPIRLIIFATSIRRSERVYLTQGNLADSLLASMSYPILLPEQRLKGDLLVDGDLTSSFSSEILKKYGAERVFGIRYDPGVTHGAPHHIITHVFQIYRLLLKQLHNLNNEIHPVDAEVLYNSSDISYFSTHQAYRLMLRGYKATNRLERKIMKALKN